MKSEAIVDSWEGKQKVWLECDCPSHVLLLSHHVFEGIEELDISMYHRGLRGDKIHWRERLTLIWRILTEGTTYGDQVCLTNQQGKIDELVAWIARVRALAKERQ